MAEQKNKNTEQSQRGVVFIMRLLMKEKCPMPSLAEMDKALEKHLGRVECFCHKEGMASFAVPKYKAEFQEGTIAPQVMVLDCVSTDLTKTDPMITSQMWDCPNSKDVLEQCRWQVVASDMMAAPLDYKDRAELLMDYLEALLELYPQCEAVLFETSGKLMPRGKLVGQSIPKEDRFLQFAVNVRYFRVEGTQDMVVDTLGMSTLSLPDVQYHFRDMNPNLLVGHARSLLAYNYANNAPIQSGQTVDGIRENRIDPAVQWGCHYEKALIGPAREVLDVYMNEYAAGRRDYEAEKKN